MALLEQDRKFYEKTIENRLSNIVKIDDKQFGFQPGKSTEDAILYYDSCNKSLEQRRKNFSLSLLI